MKPTYLEAVSLIERLHRHFLEVVKGELDVLGVDDINNVQALILYNIGNDELTVGELTQRGCYLGTNVTYNLKKLIESGYVTQQRSPRDRRSVRVRLSPRGLELSRELDSIFQAQNSRLEIQIRQVDLGSLVDRLQDLERFLADELNGGAPTSRKSRHAA